MNGIYWFERIIRRLENRFGHLAVRGLPLYIVALNAFLYLLFQYAPEYSDLFTLSVDKVMRGQVWRLVTYIFIPPMTSFFWIVFALYFIYLVGSGLEAAWGSFRFNVYYLVGMICTTIVGFFLPGENLTNAYLNLSLFLAFAAVYPDFLVYLFFVIPIKVKYLAWFNWILIILTVATGDLTTKFTALVSVVNYFLFFWPQVVLNAKLTRHDVKTLPEFSRAADMPIHKCHACGKTDYDDPELEFRVCSKCSQEYCLVHLKEHRH